MKNGQTPVHIQRWSPADFQHDEHVQLLLTKGDWATLTFYRQFLDASFLAGGDLPASPDELAACVRMPLAAVRRALVFCLGRLIFEEGGRLYQRRVRREITEEIDYRVEQTELGRRGGLMAGRGRPKGPPLNKEKGGPISPIGPPTPTPTPTPAPAPAPAPAPTPDPFELPRDLTEQPVGRLAEREDLKRLRSEVMRLLNDVREAGGDDGQAELVRASRTPQGGRAITNVEACSSAPWLRVVVDRLTARLLELREPPRSAKATQRESSMVALIKGGLRGT
jgi:hypothetical protein